MKTSIFKITLSLFAFILLAPACLADDIEVYANASTVGATPRLLFMFDISGSMLKSTDKSGKSKQKILEAAFAKLLDQIKATHVNINIGLMTFGRNYGSGIKFPVSSISASASEVDPDIPDNLTVRDVLKDLVSSSKPYGETPTVEGMYEAALYFRGDRMHYGRYGTFGKWNTAKSQYTGGSSSWRAANPASYSGNKTTEVTYLKPSERGSVGSCRDYSARPNTNRNDCAKIPQESLYDCKTYGVTQCTKKSVKYCTSWDYPVANQCILGPGNKKTPWLISSGRYCCTNSDITNSECLRKKSLRVCKSYKTVERCVGGRNKNQVFTQCHYKYKRKTTDNRTYNSPISMECQANALVILSDGAPSKNSIDYGRVTSSGKARGPYYIRKMIRDDKNRQLAKGERRVNINSIKCADLSRSIFNAAPNKYPFGNCGPELARNLNLVDQVPSIKGSTVQVHTIGFGLSGTGAKESQDYLRLLANEGGGNFYQANNVDSLVSSLQSIVSSITSDNQSFTGLGLGIEGPNLSTAAKTYVSQFIPSEKRTWSGNVKGYFIGQDGLLDVNGQKAVSDDGSGAKYLASAQSFWTDLADGGNVLKGGLRNKLNPGSRKIYVNTASHQPIDLDLSADKKYRFEKSNRALTAKLLGTSRRDELIEWTRLAKVLEPLHTTPTVVDYGGDVGEVLFSMTNQGFLHAFDVSHPDKRGDTAGGEELFSFLPYHLIGNLKKIKAKNVPGKHVYGLDGPITVKAIRSEDGEDLESVVLYFGMRRGGVHYYAMDVTDPESPILKWRIGPETAGFEGMGQSWSKMTLAKIDDGGTEREALIFGAGYDPQEDGKSIRSEDSVGNGVYIVDPESGELLQSIGGSDRFNIYNAEMKYSIPSDLRVIDSNGDKLTDRIYFGDMGGQLWAITLDGLDVRNEYNYGVYNIADLGGSTAADNRRFYYPPSVSKTMVNGEPKITLSIGSGYRAHPLNNDAQDRVFTIFDKNVSNKDISYSALSTNDLMDLTADLFGKRFGSKAIAKATVDLSKHDGWYINLADNEKVLSETRIYQKKLLYTTFSAVGSACESVSTFNRFNMVSVTNGSAIMDLDEKEEEVKEDRSVLIDMIGIAPSPQLVFLEPESKKTPSASVYVGQERVVNDLQNLFKVYWKEIK